MNLDVSASISSFMLSSKPYNALKVYIQPYPSTQSTCKTPEYGCLLQPGLNKFVSTRNRLPERTNVTQAESYRTQELSLDHSCCSL